MPEWTVPVPDELVQALQLSLEGGPIIDDKGRVAFKKRLVDEFDGLKVEIFSNEHPPPHFRVRNGNESNNFTIKDCTPLNGSGLKTYFRNIRTWHAENKQHLIEVWNASRPTDCPVGVYREE